MLEHFKQHTFAFYSAQTNQWAYFSTAQLLSATLNHFQLASTDTCVAASVCSWSTEKHSLFCLEEDTKSC